MIIRESDIISHRKDSRMHQSFLATWRLQHLVWSNVKFVQVHTATYDQVEASAFKRMCLQQIVNEPQ